MKTKGARLTTEISLPGRFVVYVPHGEGLGVSRRLEDDERNRLKAILKEIAPKKGGVIVRTAAEGASAEDIERDLDFLQRLWKSIEAQAKESKAPSLVYQEAELPLRVVRDLFTGDFERLLVDHDRTHKRIVGYLKKTSPHMAERVDALQGARAADGGVRRRAGDQVDAEPPRRSALGRLPDLRLRRGVHRHRRQHRPLRRLALEEVGRTARGHDHEEQPRGGQGGRAPAAAARHRRDHRHRLHRHGEPEEPGRGREGARRRARARPHEDLRRRDLTARPRRDDASERHRRAARGHDEEVPDLRRRRHRRLRAHGCGRRRAPAALARHARLALEGVQGRGQREGRLRSSPAPAAARLRELEETTQAALLPRRQGGRAPRPLPRARAGDAREGRARACRSTSARSSSSSSARSVCTTRTPASARSTDVDVVVGDAAKLVGKKVKVRITARRRGDGVGRAARTGRRRARAADRRGRGREADARASADAPEEGRRRGRADADETVEDDRGRGRRRGRATTRPGREARRAEPADGRRAGDAEEAHPPRHARRPEPQEEAAPSRGRGERCACERRRPATEAPRAPSRSSRPRRPQTPSRRSAAEAPAGPVIHLPDRELGDGEEDGDGTAPPKKRTRRGSRGGKNRRKKPAGALARRGEASRDRQRERPAAADVVPEPRPPDRAGAEQQRARARRRAGARAEPEPTSRRRRAASPDGDERAGVTPR